MRDLLSAPGLHINYIHFSAVITASTHIWAAAQHRHSDSFRGHVALLKKLEALYQRCVQGLRPLLADMSAREISNVVWASATLGFDPDAVVPGMRHDLTTRFLHLVNARQERQRPNAQDCANLLWAFATKDHAAASTDAVDAVSLHFGCLTQHPDAKQRPDQQACANVLWSLATMGHPAAATEVVDPICLRFASLTRRPDNRQHPTTQTCANLLWAVAKLDHSSAVTRAVHSVGLHFARLIQHPDIKQRPDAQDCANVLSALAKMGHEAAAATEVVDQVCWHFAYLVGSPTAKQRPNSQAVANLMWALGTLKHTPANDRLLDHFCAYMHTLLQSRDKRDRPSAQETASTLWALAKLKHAPKYNLVSAMLDHLVILCQTTGLQPTSQHISVSFLAFSELRVSDSIIGVNVLLNVFLKMPSSRVDYQAYYNMAWSLAVMDLLDFRSFAVLLDKLSAKLHQDAVSKKGSAQPLAYVRQLYLALSSLKPPTDSKQMEAWSGLRSSLQTIAPEPDLVPIAVPGQGQFYAALDRLGLLYDAQVLCGLYTAQAVLSSQSDTPAEVILTLEGPDEFFNNVPSR